MKKFNVFNWLLYYLTGSFTFGNFWFVVKDWWYSPECIRCKVLVFLGIRHRDCWGMFPRGEMVGVKVVKVKPDQSCQVKQAKYVRRGRFLDL